MTEPSPPNPNEDSHKNTAPAEMATKPKAQRKYWGLVSFFGITAAALAGAAFVYVWQNSYVGDTAIDAQVRTLAERVSQVEGQRAKLNTLENNFNRIEPKLMLAETTRNNLTSLQEKLESDINRLETNLRELKAGGATGAPVDLAPLEQRLQNLEKFAASQNQQELQTRSKHVALALATLVLKDALDKGLPYKAELDVLRDFIHASVDLRTLNDKAMTGIPTTEELLESFPEAAQKILRANDGEPKSAWQRFTSMLQSWIFVRPVGEVEGTTPEAILARLERRLEQKKTEEAAALFASLPEQATQQVSEWAINLKARAEADRFVRDLLINTAATLKPQS